MTVPNMYYNFRTLSNKFPTIFWSLIFGILPPRLSYFSQEKETEKISDSKMRWKEESEKFSLLLSSQIFGNEALVISKRLKLP